MSVGNLQDYGSKSTNFPWQLKVLLGLQGIIDSNTQCCDSTYSILQDINNTLAGTRRTPHIISETGPGDTVQAFSISIANVGANPGSVDGVVIPAGVTLNFDGGFNNILDSMHFDATSTTFLITYIT